MITAADVQHVEDSRRVMLLLQNLKVAEAALEAHLPLHPTPAQLRTIDETKRAIERNRAQIEEEWRRTE